MKNTLQYYNDNAKLYFEKTVDVDLNCVYSAFLEQIPKNSYILDFGCGSGRDTKFFIKNGYRVKAVDGSAEMCKLASAYINQEVECLKFEQLSDVEMYDGIWACSSILHVEKSKLPCVMGKMLRALKPNGIIYASFKIGEGEKVVDNKYYNYISKVDIENILKKSANKALIVKYFETPSLITFDDTWGNFIIKKIG